MFEDLAGRFRRHVLEGLQEGRQTKAVEQLDEVVDVHDTLRQLGRPPGDHVVRLDRFAADPARVGVHHAGSSNGSLHRLRDVIDRAARGARRLLDDFFRLEDVLLLHLDAPAPGARMLAVLDDDVTHLVAPQVVFEDHGLTKAGDATVAAIDSIGHHGDVKVLATFTLQEEVLCSLVPGVRGFEDPVAAVQFQRSHSNSPSRVDEWYA